MREVPISAPFLFCEDITGNGIPNVVVDLSCGCSMATGSTHIFELHPEFILREVFSSTGTTGYAVNTVADLDGDGVMEFIVSEHYYFPFFDYKAHPSSRVVLRWTGSTYALDLDLMRHLPSPEGYQSVLEEAKQLWGSSDEREKKAQGWRLYNAVIDLIYSGNWDTAWKLFDDVLPTGFRGSSKEELLVKIIKESHYGLEILAEYAGASTQYKLGEVYANRDSVSSDWAEAVRWSHLYGSRNSWVKSGRAVPDFGEFQEQRRQALEAIFPDWVESVFPNWVEAEKRYRRAANLGMADAMARLGVMYAGGRPGVSQDNVQAHVWYGLAASRLAPERLGRVVEFRDFLADQMTVDQLSEAERLSREFDAAHPREP